MKNIFELSNEDIKKIEAEFRNTSYFKKYMLSYIGSIVVLFSSLIFFAFIWLTFVWGDIESWNMENTPTFSMITTLFFLIGCTILVACLALISLIFKYKKLDLMKQ